MKSVEAIANLFQTTFITEERPSSSDRDEHTRFLLAMSVCARTKKFLELGVEVADLDRGKQLMVKLGAEPIVSGDNPIATAEQFNLLAEAVALLSCCPGGVEAFGLRFETTIPSLLKPKTFELTSKRSKRYRAAQQAALRAGQELIQSWATEYPLQGYAQLGSRLNDALREEYRDIGIENKVEIAHEVRNVLFAPLLPEYERLFGQETVRSCLSQLYE